MAVKDGAVVDNTYDNVLKIVEKKYENVSFLHLDGYPIDDLDIFG